jgi:LysR family transcriptional regulator, transcription activator of glutamate synthase operon
MDLQQLEYFETVATTMNVTKAAEQLYISQSSLSQTIKRLEAEVGYPLFKRTGKHILLNENGVIFLSCVQKIKEALRSANDELEERNQITSRELTVFVGCASLYLPDLLVYLKENTKDLLFRIYQWNNKIENNQDMDLKIIALSEPQNNENSFLLLEEDILLALPKKHPLSTKDTIQLSDLTKEEFISLNSHWSLENTITEHCRLKGMNLFVTIQADNPVILRELLRKNLGIAFIPEKTWGNSFVEGGLELRTVTDFSIKRYVYLEWQEGYLRQNVSQCIALIKNFFNCFVNK